MAPRKSPLIPILIGLGLLVAAAAVVVAVNRKTPAEAATPQAQNSAPSRTPFAATLNPGTGAAVPPAAVGGPPTSMAPVAVAPAPAAGPAPADGPYLKLVQEAKQAILAERFKVALGSYRKALALKPDSAEARAGVGIALVMGDSNYKEAVQLLEEALKTDDKNAKGWLSLGMAYQNIGKNSLAWQPYKRYLELEPGGDSSDEIRAMLKDNGQQ